MPLTVECPECFQTYTVPEKLAGKKIKCKSCSAPIVVRKQEEFQRLPPRAAASQAASSKSKSKKKKKRNPLRISAGFFLSLFNALFSIGGMVVVLIAFTALGMYINTFWVINYFFSIAFFPAFIRRKVRQGEIDVMTGLAFGALAIGVFFVNRQYGARSISSGPRSKGALVQQTVDQPSYTGVPRDLALPAGTKLSQDFTGKMIVTVSENAKIGEDKVRVRFDNSDVAVAISRSDLMIRSDVLQQLRVGQIVALDPVAANRASVARAQQAKSGHFPDPNLVAIPIGFPVREGVELYHHSESRDAWYKVSALYSTENRVKIQYLENDTEPTIPVGSERTVARSELYIDRATVKDSRSNAVE